MRIKSYAPIVLLLCAVAYVGFAVFGDESYSHLQLLEEKLQRQASKNRDVRREIDELEKEVYFLQHDDRTLEKAARNELGLARHGELIFVFDHFLEEGDTQE